MIRGKCISISDTFLWLDGLMLGNIDDPGAKSATLVGVENLNAFMLASDMLDLSRSDIEDIFYNNAMELLGYNE